MCKNQRSFVRVGRQRQRSLVLPLRKVVLLPLAPAGLVGVVLRLHHIGTVGGIDEESQTDAGCLTLG
jgi:hypothetical protein